MRRADGGLAMRTHVIASIVIVLTATSGAAGQPREWAGPRSQEMPLPAWGIEHPPASNRDLVEAASEAASPESQAFAAAVRQVLQEYKFGESWPRRNFEGLDFLEPLWPRVAVARGDVGRVVLNSALPYSLLTAAFAAESTDQSTLAEITRWNWVGIDQAQNNNPLLFGLLALAGASVFLPSPEDRPGYSWALRLDRATVFALGVGTASLQTAILKPIFDRTRPNGTCCTSRPSGHATTAFAAMAFLSNVLRDVLRPQEEPHLGLRILKEVTTAVPYLGAGYMALERVHAREHFLTDTLLGGAIGTFTTDMLYAWSFTQTEQGRNWLGHISVRYDPARRGVELAITGRF
jgi:membrane-associated phospholipid phosphatase